MKENDQETGTAKPFDAAPLFGGITKEMWTILIDHQSGWQPSDVFCDTAEECRNQLKEHQAFFKKYNHKPGWLDGAAVTRCIISIYPPNEKEQARAKNL